MKIIGGPITLITVAIIAAIAVWKNWDAVLAGTKKTMSSVGDWFGDLDLANIIDGFTDSLKDINFEELGQKFGTLLTDAIHGTLGFIGDFWSNIFTADGARGVAGALWDAIKAVLGGLGSFLVGVFKGVDYSSIVKGLGSLLKDIALKAFEFFKTKVSQGLDFFSSINWGDFASKLGKAFMSGIKSVYHSIVSFFGDIWYSLTGFGTQSEDSKQEEAEARKQQQIEHEISTLKRKEEALIRNQAVIKKAKDDEVEGIKRSKRETSRHAAKVKRATESVGNLTTVIDALKTKIQSMKDAPVTVVNTETTDSTSSTGGRGKYRNTYARGGWVEEAQHFATGGAVSGAGTGTSDSIPTMLSNGEFVINAKATAKNRSMLEWINSGATVKDMEEVFSIADMFGEQPDFDIFEEIGRSLGGITTKEVAGMMTPNVGIKNVKTILASPDDRYEPVRSMDDVYGIADTYGNITDSGLFNEIESMMGRISYDEVEGLVKRYVDQGGQFTVSNMDQVFKIADDYGNITDNKLYNLIERQLVERGEIPNFEARDYIERYTQRAADTDRDFTLGKMDHIYRIADDYGDITSGGLYDQLENMMMTKKGLSSTTARDFIEKYVNYNGDNFTVSNMDQVYRIADMFGDETALGDMSIPFDRLQGSLGRVTYNQARDTIENYINRITASSRPYPITDMEEVFGIADELGGVPNMDIFDDIERVLKFGGGINSKQVEDILKSSMGISYANGGDVRGKGSGTSDSIPAMLSNGEFVINARSTKMFRPLLEQLNAKGLSSGSPQAFKCGGMVHPQGFEEGGIADSKSYQFLQFAEGGKQGSFDVELTISRFLQGLDRADPAVQKLVTNLDKLSSKSKDRTQQQLLKLDLSARVNKQLVDLVKINKEHGEVNKGTIGSVRDLGTAASKTAGNLENEWKGMSKELTGPIKKAFLEGGSIGEGIKEGMRNLLKGIQNKLMDRAMKPLEDALDGILNDLFGTESEGKGTTSSPMITKDISDTGVGGLFGDAGDSEKENPLKKAIMGTTKAVTDGTKTTGGFFDSLGGLFSQGWEWLTEAFSGLGDTLSGLFSGGGGAGGGGGGIGGMISGLFGGGGGGGLGGLFGGGGHSMIDGIGVSSFFSGGGIVPKKGMRPQYFANGGMARGTDTVPAMLTPGEMVLNKDQQAMMGGGGVTINQTLNITEAMDPQKFQQELIKNNKVVVGLVQQSYQKRGQMGPQGYGQ